MRRPDTFEVILGVTTIIGMLSILGVYMTRTVCVKEHYEKQPYPAADTRYTSRPPTYRMQWVCDSAVARKP